MELRVNDIARVMLYSGGLFFFLREGYVLSL